MFALCVEASHQRGMGHLFRAMVLADAIRAAGRSVHFFVNDFSASLALLAERGQMFTVVPLLDPHAGWQASSIASKRPALWIDDRLHTDLRHAAAIAEAGLSRVTFDDEGEGARLADLNVAGLVFDNRPLEGRRVLRGPDFLILNPEIATYRYRRRGGKRIIVSLGGADTHGVTPKVVAALAAAKKPATVVLGPAFQHRTALNLVATPAFEILSGIPSLVEEMARHDIAVTGGGMTAVEACASGLATIIIANELFEIPVGQALATMGCAVFAGYHDRFDAKILSEHVPVASLSATALDSIGLDGIQRVVQAILAL